MSIKSTIYDILGYFIPGLLFILLVFASIAQINCFSNIFENAVSFYLKGGLSIVFFVIIISYILGFLISGLSNIFSKKLSKLFSNYADYEKIIDSESLEVIKTKFKQLYGISLNSNNIRLVINDIENHKPALYSTTLYFMSFYGMARSSFLIFIIFSVIQSVIIYLHFGFLPILILIIYLSLAILFLYQYLRFLKYFNQQIFYSFLVNK